MQQPSYKNADGTLRLNRDGRTTLMAAIDARRTARALAIIDEAKTRGELKSLMDFYDPHGNTALGMAAALGNRPVALRLYTEGDDPDRAGVPKKAPRHLVKIRIAFAASKAEKRLFSAILADFSSRRSELVARGIAGETDNVVYLSAIRPEPVAPLALLPAPVR